MSKIIDWKEVFQELDGLVKSGKRQVALERLEEISPNHIPRKLMVDYANLSRRLGAFIWGIRLLRPVVYRLFPGIEPAPDEVAIYAGLLIKIGVFREAEKLLRQIDGQTPMSSLFMAFSAITQWNQIKAIPHLKKYINVVEDPYQRAMAQVNLTASYISCEWYAKALELSQELLRVTEENGWDLLQMNVLELTLQIQVNRPDVPLLDVQRKKLQGFIEKVSSQQGIYWLFLNKWEAILDLRRKGVSQQRLNRLAQLRESAVAMKHYETIRDVDYNLAVFRGDFELARQVFFGTPYPSYRSRMLREFPVLKEQKSYTWELRLEEGWEAPQPQAETAPRFDVETTKFNGHSVLGLGSALHRGLMAVTRDFYRPISMGSLFNLVYSDEVYDPEHSPVKIYKMLQRLRAELEEKGVPLAVILQNREASVSLAQGALDVVLPVNREAPSREKIQNEAKAQLLQLRENFRGRSFTSQQAAQALELSQRRTQSLLTNWARRRKVRKIGSGRGTRYMLAG